MSVEIESQTTLVCVCVANADTDRIAYRKWDWKAPQNK